jgi:hypothetical protein
MHLRSLWRSNWTGSDWSSDEINTQTHRVFNRISFFLFCFQAYSGGCMVCAPKALVYRPAAAALVENNRAEKITKPTTGVWTDQPHFTSSRRVKTSELEPCCRNLDCVGPLLEASGWGRNRAEATHVSQTARGWALRAGGGRGGGRGRAGPR